MKVQVNSLGALRYAELTLGEMTIICGDNNTGKTYAAYALYGFLYLWRDLISINISQKKTSDILNNGVVTIDISPYIDDIENILLNGCKKYSGQLSRIFATSAEKLKGASFSLTLDFNKDKHIKTKEQYERRISSSNREQISITKNKESEDITVTLLTDSYKVNFPHEIISKIICDTIEDIIFRAYFPTPFIASAERTGAAIFRKELNFARNRLLKEMSLSEKNIDPMDLLFKSYQDYALPVEKDVDFIRQLEALAKKTGFIQEHHPDILNDFAIIVGGKYTVTKDDELYFIPDKKNLKLTMDESSSSVRSLIGIGFYLKHLAKPGDILIVDEPELNLHPENQRKIARLFSRLVNIGIKIFITTHSDYIIKELNTLIMLGNNSPHLKDIAKNEGYSSKEIIKAEKIKVYIAEESLVKVPGNKIRTTCQTLTQANIDSIMGIEARSFDQTIETMNRIQDEIIWGAN
ncbi:ATP-binding protein [Desulfobacterales bacterium HSG16]|nr:ATP-binding protein [Desulfobacterales bacterium HSG16]